MNISDSIDMDELTDRFIYHHRFRPHGTALELVVHTQRVIEGYLGSLSWASCTSRGPSEHAAKILLTFRSFLTLGLL